MDSSNINPGSSSSPLNCCDWGAITARAKAILTDPVGCWPSIKAESKSIKEIYLTYVIPLTVIGVLCEILGRLLFGGGGGFFSMLINAVVTTVVQLALMLLVAYIYKFVAGQFGGTTDETSTFKLIAYSSTASMVGRFLTIIPPLGIVSILFAIYSIYTLYQGIPAMTGITSKRLPYFLVSIVATIIVYVVIGGAIIVALGVGAATTATLA